MPEKLTTRIAADTLQHIINTWATHWKPRSLHKKVLYVPVLK